jgi:hypothetical protein
VRSGILAVLHRSGIVTADVAPAFAAVTDRDLEAGPAKVV